MLVSSYFKVAPGAFLDAGTDGCVRIYGRERNKRTAKYLEKKYLLSNAYLDTYNLLVPEANGSGKFGEALSSPFISLPEEGTLDSFISIGTFASMDEVLSFEKYLKTKFFRALLGVKKVTQHTPKSVWEYIPLQDFTPSSDIDWAQSIADINAQLYEKYSLSQEEIAFIETHVKEMD